MADAAGSSDARTRWLVGVGTFALGAFVAAIGVRWIDIAPTEGTPHWVIVLVGAVFSLAGVAVMLPQRPSRLHDVIGALLFTAFAAIALWVGFGPGERHFSGGLSLGPVALGGGGGEALGRFMFGAMGVLVALIALVAWRRVLRGDAAGATGAKAAGATGAEADATPRGPD